MSIEFRGFEPLTKPLGKDKKKKSDYKGFKMKLGKELRS